MAAAWVPLHGAAVSDWSGLAEGLVAADISILSAETGSTFSTSEESEVDWHLRGVRHEVDYRPNQPIDPLGRETKLSDDLAEGRIGFLFTHSRWQHRATLSGYSGFRSYTAMWIDAYYRQQYGSGGIPGVAYEDPDPYGYGIELSSRYEWKPASTYITLSLAYLKDRVAPGYEIGDLGTSFELVRGDTRLHTWTGAVIYEGVLNSFTRTRQSLRLTETTSREIRLSWNGALNLALGDRWISRTGASFAVEDPNFEAWSVSQTMEYEWLSGWAVSLTARYYEDTGQIETANLISSAAPALATRSLYLTLRKSNLDGTAGFSLSFGPYLSGYAPTGIGTERFAGLYRDRDWWWGRFAFQKSF